jgi:hypothetical protein
LAEGLAQVQCLDLERMSAPKALAASRCTRFPSRFPDPRRT